MTVPSFVTNAYLDRLGDIHDADLTIILVDATQTPTKAMVTVDQITAEVTGGAESRTEAIGAIEAIGDTKEASLVDGAGDPVVPTVDADGVAEIVGWWVAVGTLGVTADADMELVSFNRVVTGPGTTPWSVETEVAGQVFARVANDVPTTTTVAAAVTVDATGFTGNLSGTDTDVQTALETLDALPVGGGGGGSIVGADDLDLSASSWPITADLSSWTNAGALILLPAPVSADPADSVLTVTLPDAGEGATLSVRCAVDTGTMDAVDVQFGGYDPGDDPWGVRDSAVSAHEAWLHVHYFDGGATWLAKWQPVTLAGGTGDVVGPASSTDGHLALFDGTSGKLIKDGGAVTAAGLALLDDADAAAQRTTLGLNVLGGQDEGTAVTSTSDTTLLDSTPTISGLVAGDVVVFDFATVSTNTSGSGRTHTIKPKLGATTLGTLSFNAANTSGASTAGRVVVRAEGTSDQNVAAHLVTSNSGGTPVAATVSTENLSSGVAFNLLGAIGAGGSQSITLQYLTITRYHA